MLNIWSYDLVRMTVKTFNYMQFSWGRGRRRKNRRGKKRSNDKVFHGSLSLQNRNLVQVSEEPPMLLTYLWVLCAQYIKDFPVLLGISCCTTSRFAEPLVGHCLAPYWPRTQIWTTFLFSRHAQVLFTFSGCKCLKKTGFASYTHSWWKTRTSYH